ncbi:hypothetical protein VDGD_20495 [Verticillium dahliae]|nr:hypothetical protein VDGD_20495 [Verticillium dahliae]
MPPSGIIFNLVVAASPFLFDGLRPPPRRLVFVTHVVYLLSGGSLCCEPPLLAQDLPQDEIVVVKIPEFELLQSHVSGLSEKPPDESRTGHARDCAKKIHGVASRYTGGIRWRAQRVTSAGKRREDATKRDERRRTRTTLQPVVGHVLSWFRISANHAWMLSFWNVWLHLLLLNGCVSGCSDSGQMKLWISPSMTRSSSSSAPSPSWPSPPAPRRAPPRAEATGLPSRSNQRAGSGSGTSWSPSVASCQSFLKAA